MSYQTVITANSLTSTLTSNSLTSSISRNGTQGSKGDSVTAVALADATYVAANPSSSLNDLLVTITTAGGVSTVTNVGGGGFYTGAQNASTQAQAAQAAAETALDSFDDRYLGSKTGASDPTLDNDGDALLTGAIFWDADINRLKFYSGSAWEDPITTAITQATTATTQATAAASSASSAAASVTTCTALESFADTSATNAGVSATSASGSASTATTQAGIATTQASNASTSASNASASSSAASTSATNAATSESNALTSANNASASATAAAGSANAASTSANNAGASETNAATSATNAASSEANANTSATSATNSASSASTSATTATTQATNAATSATSAANSLTAVQTVFDNFDDTYLGSKSSDPSVDNDGDALVAGQIYFNTTTNKVMFYNGATWQSPSAAAATSATQAATSATNAATSETNAATSETNAATSATNASNSASTATTQATNAATSASNAATSETNASNSATSSASSATNSATSATNASNSANAAQTAQNAAENALDLFDDRMLGSKTSDPSVDNDGNALQTGAIYWNSSSNELKVYSGSSWVAPATQATTAATNASTSETNAATSETNAQTHASNANTSATNAAASLASFQNIYHGPSGSDPSTNLNAGDLYFNTTSSELRIYTGSAWNPAAFNTNSALFDNDFASQGIMLRGASSGSYSILTDNSSNWNTAFGWGDHSSAGYLTSETSHADVLIDGDFASAGIMATNGSGTYSIITDNSSNWNTAHGWGDHSTAGYLTSVPAQSFASLTGKPTTISGYGITDAYDDSDFDTRLASKTTDDVSEGSGNLYFTNTRADARATIIAEEQAIAMAIALG